MSRGGRHQEFERLYTTHAQPLLAFLTYRLGDRTLAEDLLADTFERVLRARRPFDRRRASEKTWLYAIALNLVRDHVRRTDAARRALERVTADRGEDPHDEFESLDDREALRLALSRLSAEELEAIALRYGADLTIPEIARITGEHVSTVEGRVYRGLRKLKAELAPSTETSTVTGR